MPDLGAKPNVCHSPVSGDGVQRDVHQALLQAHTRRHFLRSLGSGLGTVFMGTLAARYALSANTATPAAASPELDFSRDPSTPLSVLPPQFAAKARRVIYLHIAGDTSPLETLCHKHRLT